MLSVPTASKARLWRGSDGGLQRQVESAGPSGEDAADEAHALRLRVEELERQLSATNEEARSLRPRVLQLQRGSGAPGAEATAQGKSLVEAVAKWQHSRQAVVTDAPKGRAHELNAKFAAPVGQHVHIHVRRRDNVLRGARGPAGLAVVRGHMPTMTLEHASEETFRA